MKKATLITINDDGHLKVYKAMHINIENQHLKVFKLMHINIEYQQITLVWYGRERDKLVSNDVRHVSTSAADGRCLEMLAQLNLHIGSSSQDIFVGVGGHEGNEFQEGCKKEIWL